MSCRTEELHRFPAWQPVVAIQPGGPALRPEGAGEVFEWKSFWTLDLTKNAPDDTWRFISWWFVMFVFLKWTPVAWKHAWLRAVQCRTWSKWLLLFWPHFQKISSNIMSTLGATKLSSFQTWVIRTPKSLSVSFQIRKEKVPKKQFFWQFCSSDPGYTMGRCCSVSAYYDQYGGHAVCLKLADLSPRPLLFLRNVLGSERLVMSIISYGPRWYILFYTLQWETIETTSPRDLRNQSSALGQRTAQSLRTACHAWKVESGPRIRWELNGDP